MDELQFKVVNAVKTCQSTKSKSSDGDFATFEPIPTARCFYHLPRPFPFVFANSNVYCMDMNFSPGGRRHVAGPGSVVKIALHIRQGLTINEYLVGGDSLGNIFSDAPTSPVPSRRAIHSPGGRSSLDLFNDCAPPEVPRSSIKLAAPPGGQTSLSLTGGGSPSMTRSIKVMQPAGGITSVSLDGAGELDLSPSIRPMAPPGGRTSLNLDGSGQVPVSPHIRTIAPPGGKSSLTLDGAGQVPIHSSIKTLAAPGGMATVSLAGAGSPPHTPSIRTRHAPGGPTTLDLAGRGTEPITPPPSIKPRAPPGGVSSLDLSGGGNLDGRSFSGRRIVVSPYGSSIIGSEYDESEEGIQSLSERFKAAELYEGEQSPGRRPSWKDGHEEEEELGDELVPGALAYQSALPPVHRSQIVIGDDSPDSSPLTPQSNGRPHHIRVQQAPGGTSSISFF
ncbi:hypothetical protein SpCBS45565_g03950 [Spizellomyces sp. 'palustris']|nr:hypothetical protein SpCBS45565_g03950 [Spizellomyces sp. 'palustris']